MSEDFYCDQVLNGKTEVRIVRETNNVLAFYHTKPFWETHIVVIPKKHISSLLTLKVEDEALFLELFRVIREVSQDVVDSQGSARILTNVGAYQESKHLHFHINYGKQIRLDETL